MPAQQPPATGPVDAARLDLADGEGARWALTHDKDVIGPQDPEFRIKRNGPDGTVVSNPVPPGDVPTGDLVAAGGGVWLPVRDAVLRFDPGSETFTSFAGSGPNANVRQILGRPGEVWLPESGLDRLMVIRTGEAGAVRG